MLCRNWDGVLAWHRTHLTTRPAGSAVKAQRDRLANSLIQAARANAHGYRTSGTCVRSSILSQRCFPDHHSP